MKFLFGFLLVLFAAVLTVLLTVVAEFIKGILGTFCALAFVVIVVGTVVGLIFQFG